MAEEYRVDYTVAYNVAYTVYINKFYIHTLKDRPIMTYADVLSTDILNFLNSCPNRVQDKSVEFNLLIDSDVTYNIYFKNKKDAVEFKLRFGTRT